MIGIGTRAEAQDRALTNLDRTRALGLDSLDSGYRVFYSAGYAERAAAMGHLAAASNTFYRDSLGVDVAQLYIALLDPADYQRAAFPGGIPYGLPFVNDRVVVQPADLSVGLVRDAYAPYESTASPSLSARLGSVGLSYAEALPIMFDAIALHELGHVQANAYGLNTRQPWFSELMATYLGYAFMRVHEPEMAVVWDVVLEAGREGYEPTHTSLDDLNRLYAGVGFENYIWYQNIFQDRVHVLYDLHGLDFVRAARERLADADWTPETAAELIDALDEIAPGFAGWAGAYER
ncbi:MAG: hypothetical protein R2834_21685 [Rhodothermales bacterium]